MAIKILSLLVLTLSSVGNLLAQTLTLSDQGRYETKHFIQYLKDEKGTLSFDDVVTNDAFVKTSTLNFGFDNAVHWFAFEVENTIEEEEWFLEIAFSPLDKIDFYYPADSGWVHKVSGDTYPIATRDIRHSHPVFSFQLKKDQKMKCFIRVHTTSSVQLPAIIWDPHVFYNSYFNIQIFNGLFYGALLIMIIYQLFLFLSTRDRISIYYVFTLFAMMHVVSYFQGYSFLYLYPGMPQLNHYMAIITGPFFLIFSTWLTRAFLNLKETNPWLDKLLMINVGLDVVAAVLMVFFFGALSYRFHHYAILIHSLLALAAAAFGIYKRFRPALFYLLSWLTLLVCALIFSMSNLGVFREYLVTDSAWLIVGCVLQMLFISFALGNRWIILNRENQLSKDLIIKREQVEKVKLENEVRLRTVEIHSQNQRLEEVNQIKDKLFSIVSHDIKGPLTSLQLALGLIKNETINPEEFRELAQILEVRFNQTTEFIQNLLQWASLQLKGITFDPVVLSAHKEAQDTLMLLDFEIKNKNIAVQNQIPAPFMVFADANMVKSIFRNLLMNAIKFTSKGGSITLDAKTSEGFITISVSDNGIGIPEVNKKKLFSLDGVTTLGTKKEKGTGLGLLLCKEFVERNHGRIWFESEEGKGTTFYFDLPLQKGFIT